MPDTNDNDIDGLRGFLSLSARHSYNTIPSDVADRYHRALTALVAERNALKEENIALRSRQKAYQDEVLDRVFEMDALRKRIAELESQSPASELRERLVCAALTAIVMAEASYADAAEGAVRYADATLAEMRKGGGA